MNVIKRDGTEVLFDKEKIYNAITKANKAIINKGKQGLSDTLIRDITNNLSDRFETFERTITVEEIQDAVEDILISTGNYHIVKEYITYRYNHSLMRNKYKELMEKLKEKLIASNVQNQNANVDEKSFGGRAGEANDYMLREFALNNCMSKMAKDNHINNEIYIHDLGHYVLGDHNCLTVPIDKLLANGFNTRQTDIRAAQSLSTAMQLLAVIFQLQSLQQFGGVSSSHTDWSMVPYVRKSFYKHWKTGMKYIEEIEIKDENYTNSISENIMESIKNTKSIESDDYKKYSKAYKYALDMTKKEIDQSAEALFHNLDSLQSRSGNQLPFSSINYGTCTLPEGRMVIKAILETSIKGQGKLGRTSIFPCQIFQVGEGINKHKGDPNYDLFRLALKSTSLRLYPNYVNIDWSGNEGYDKNDPTTYMSTMGKCKLQLM